MQRVKSWCGALSAIGMSVVAYVAMAEDNKTQDKP